MIEIVFSMSAYGWLKLAQGFAKGEAFHFPLCWSVGSISEDIPGQERWEALCGLRTSPLAVYGIREQLDRTVEDAAIAFPAVLSRAAEGEAIRVWYSGQPDELCGFCWLMAQLGGLDCHVSAVKLPRHIEKKDCIVRYSGWHEVLPEEWQQFVHLEEPVTPLMRSAAASHWRTLQEENTPLRAVVNGRLLGVPADFYDSLLRMELPPVGEEFLQGRWIVKFFDLQLGIDDGLLASRLDAMIQAGELEIVREAPEDHPRHSRILRRLG